MLLDLFAENFWLLIPLVMIPMYLFERWRQKKLRTAYLELSQRLGGQVTWDGGRPTLEFQHDGHSFTLSTSRGASESSSGRSSLDTTFLEVYTPESLRFFFLLGPENEQSFVDKALGTKKETEVGDKAFDKAYLIQSDREDLARRFLTESQRKRLLATPRPINSKMYLRINEGSFRSFAHGYLNSREALDFFIQESLHYFASAQRLWSESGGSTFP